MDHGVSSRVKILFEDGVCEEVSVSFAGECRCRLEETPLASSTDARLGDVLEFEPEDGIAKMRRIVERSPLETLTWTVHGDVATSAGFASLLARIEERGGRVERAFGGTYLVHVRPDEREEAERMFAGLAAR